MRHKGTLVLGVLLAGFGSVGVVGEALAQDAGAVDEESRQQTITVTAQKREQALQDVAGSITAFDAATIGERGLNDVESLAQSVPGVLYTEPTGSGQLTIRGVGLLVNTGVAEGNVAVHVDGVFQARASTTTLSLLDLERIEVLRGPQGTLYGRNATGGSVNYHFAKPTETFEGQVTLGAGAYSAFEARGFVSGPVADGSVLGRIAIGYREDDGFYDNVFTGQSELGRESFGARGAIRILPADAWTIDVSAWHQHEDFAGPIQTPIPGPHPLVSALEAAMILPPGFVVQGDAPYETAGELAPSSETESTGVVLDAVWDISDRVTVRSLTGYTEHKLGPQRFDGDGTSLGIVNVGREGKPRLGVSDAWSQEVNLSGVAAEGRLDWLLGAFYFSEEHDHTIPIEFPDPIVQATLGAGFAGVFGQGTLLVANDQSITEETTSSAVFADVTYALTDRLRFNFGARYTDDTKDFRQTASVGIVAGGVTPITLPSCESLETSLDFSGTNFKARAEFDATDDALLYGQFQNSFKDGGVNLTGCGDVFPEEKIDAFEIGAKTVWMDGALTINAAAFVYDYEDLQVFALRELTAVVDSIPQADISGGEIELVARPTDAFSFDLGLALLDTEIDGFVSIDDTRPDLGLQDLSGRDLPVSPAYTVLAGIDYGFTTGFGDLDLRGEVFHSDAYNFRAFGEPDSRQDAYTLVNLYAIWTDPSERYSVRGFVKNAADEEYFTYLISGALNGDQGVYAPPRIWGLELSVDF